MVEFQEQGAGYAKRYHAQGHDAKLAMDEESRRQAGEKGYLESGTMGRAPVFDGNGRAAMGMEGGYDRTRFLAAVDGVYKINGDDVDVNYKKSRNTGTSKKNAYDFGEFVVSANKSWSIAIGMAKGEERVRLEAILEASMKDAFDHMESLARVRVTENGLTRWEKPVGIVAARFDHAHNRRGDSHRHEHWGVMRHAMCTDSKVRTLDMSIFMQAQYEIDAVMKTSFARRAAEAGFKLEMTANGPELALAPLALRDAMSNGTKEIETFLKEHGIDFDQASHNEKAWANAMTKLAKVHFSGEHIERITRDKFKAAGFDFDAFRAAPELASYKLEPKTTARKAIALALEEIHERKDVIQSRYMLSLAAARYSEWSLSVNEISKGIDSLVASGYLVFRGEGTGLASRGAGKMTSQFAIERERSAVELYKRGVGKGKAITDAAGAQRVIDAIELDIRAKTGLVDAKLSAGQVAMIQTALLSPDRITVTEGDPGTGKTTGMQAVKNAAEAAGWTCVGFAPSDQARDALTSSGVKSETVQFATRSDAFWEQVDNRTIIIIDEAGMVDAGEMRILLQKAEEKGARVQLVGDRKQLQSVGAGMAYARIATYAKKSGALVELTEMNRARTTDNKSLHMLSRDDQLASLQKLMQPGIARADRATLRDVAQQDGSLKTVIDVVGFDGRARGTIELDALKSGELAGLQRGVAFKVDDVDRNTVKLQDAAGATVQAVMADGGPAGKVWSNSSAAARYDYLARRYTELSPEEAYRAPIIVDTNVDLAGVTAAIREKLNIKSVFEVQTFESRNMEVAKHLSSTSYEVGDCIKMTQKGEGFKKGELLTVLSVERDKLRVRMQDGKERDFIPSRHGMLATVGEVESCKLGVGDFVRFTAKWAAVGVRNGDRGVIRAIDARGKARIDIIDYDGVKRETKELELGKGPVGIRAGYAATVHALQGGTMDRGFYLASNTSRNSWLVAATRFRYGFQLVADVGTKKTLEALAIRSQTHQHKESALPSQEDLAMQMRKPMVNAAWPTDRTQLVGADGRIKFLPFSTQIEITRASVAQFLVEAKQTHGHQILIDGGERFVELAKEVAKSRPDLGITVKTTPVYEAAREVKQERKAESSRSTPAAR
jgi:conjugative relaxase-like TrwC/TraI family protein